MKTKLRKFSRRTVSMVLAMLMMVSVLGIGSLISANAWDAAYSNKTYYNVAGTFKDQTSGDYSNDWHEFDINSSGICMIYLKNNYDYYFEFHSDNSIKWQNFDYQNTTINQGSTERKATIEYASGTKSDFHIKPTGGTAWYVIELTSIENDTSGWGWTDSYPGDLKWKFYKATTYDVQYKKGTYGSGTEYTDTKTKDKDLTLRGATFNRTGYTQTAWASNAAGTTKSKELSATYSDNAALTLYPYWTANKYDITYKDKGNTSFSGTHASGYPTKHTYGTATTLKSASKTGYTFDGWYTTSDCSGTAVTSLGATSYTSNITLYAKWTAKTSALTFNLSGGSGTAPTGKTATYGSGMPTYGQSAPTKTGYTFAGFYDAESGGTQYYTSALASARSWNKDTTDGTTLYARWTEVKAGATVKAYTDGTASGTGGKVKNGTSGSAVDSFTLSDAFGISTKATVLSTTPTTGYDFKGWETAGTQGSHIKLYINSDCSTEYVKATHGSTYTTIYVKSDGTSGLTTANAEVHALYEIKKYTITNNGAYHKTGAAAYTSGNTGGTFTVSQTGSIAYNTTLTMTATAASGYAVEGIYWSNNGGSTWTKVTTSNTTSGGYVTSATNNSFKVTDNFTLKAMFVQVLKLSAFDSYELNSGNVTFVTAPPKSIKVKHTDAHGTETTYTYSYSGTAAKGNPDSPDVVNASGTLAIGTASYGQGNYIQYFAGDEITLTYSAMASSELLKGVFYNNSTDFYVNKPTAGQFVAHSHPTTPAIYMVSNYYTNAQINSRTFTGVTVDQDAHSVKFTATQNYKNIDVEIAKKRKVYFSDYKNAVISSKNMDDYYFDNEALSVTGDQLTVAAAQSATQTNKIDNASGTAAASKPGFYRANADGSKGDALTSSEISTYGLSIATGTSTSTSAANGTALAVSGNMPPFDLYVDLNMQNSYTIYPASKLISDLGGSSLYLKQKASTVTIGSVSAPSSAYVSSTAANVATGSTVSMTVSDLTSGYMFVGWYWGDSSAPDLKDGFISDKKTLSYAPKKSGTIWAVGTKDLYINGSKYITGKNSNWYSENSSWKNQHMSVDTETGRYYWEITDTMFTAAGSNFKTWKSNWNDWSEMTTAYGIYKESSSKYYWTNNSDDYHGKSYFQLLDTETGNDSKSIWNGITSFTVDTPANGPTYGKIYPKDSSDSEGQWNGQGFINFNETEYEGYSSPLRIYYDANASGNARLSVEATPIYSNLYVSNGFDVGSTLKSDAVTVQPVYNGNVVSSGQTGYYTVHTEGSGWDPDTEGHVAHIIPKKKGATVRITKETRGGDKIAAFLIYNVEDKTVRAVRDVKTGTASGGKTPYYIDLTLENVRQSLYIVPIVEESGANVTITFDATQLNRAQWGDIVTAYAWYQSSGGNALGGYPGQPMIPSDDMASWTTTFKGKNSSNNELEGITFSNYVDGNHSWLGCSGVMGSVSDHASGDADGGIINVYNHVSSGDNGEYSRTNFKAQTYDYREPIALYDRFTTADEVSISFAMKDGNSNLLSRQHSQLTDVNILTLKKPSNNTTYTWSKLKWEYLTNAKGDQYIDMNGHVLGENNKPTASFYVAAKGQVMYGNSNMNYVFHTGKKFDSVTGVTYGAASGIGMNYAVQWYVYDAQGNYITNVLSAGIADLAAGETDTTYIAKQLEDLGYAVDGKSVAMCYDKPRYMYGDAESGSGAVGYNNKRINVGNNFDAYRFTGQWNAVATTENTKVNVEVAMMTDSGEVLANSNTAGYGNAAATLKSGVTFTVPTSASVASDGSWAQTASKDAKLNGIELNASSQNFIGWYYYDANTEEFTKASYKSNEGFRPNYTNKDVTYYAVYRASAVYKFNYTGREVERTYSVAGNDLTEAEMTANSVITPESHENDIKDKVPVGIGIFKNTIDFSKSNYGNWTKTPDSKGYILDISGFATSTPEYTLTAHYKLANGNDATITKSAVYNGAAVNLTDLNSGIPVTSYYNKTFLGWYAYDGGTVGDLISTQTNYGLRLTRDQAVIAVYDEDNHSLPSAGLHVAIDENEVNKELTTSTTGVYYNDTIVRVRDGSNVRASALPSGAKVGILVVCDNKTNGTINNYNSTQLATLANAVSSGSTRKTASGLSITNMQATSVTSFNRTDIAVRADYKTNLGAKYCVYAYVKNGSTYTFSAASAVKTYE